MVATLQQSHREHIHQEAQRLMLRAILRMAGIAALIVLFMLLGCASLPADVQRTASHAVVDDVQATPIGSATPRGRP